MSYATGSHTVVHHGITYHIVWITKDRHNGVRRVKGR